jgi:methionyl-tRNA formyltransferase
MGTPDFAVASLDALVKNHFNVVGVVTAADKPSGRGQQLSQSPVKKYALENNLRLLQPQNLKATDFIEELKSLKADLQIVVAFRMLPEAVWNMPPEGTYNLHASLLPKYRGAAPINWAVINGEQESGVTTFRLKHEIDTGNILLQEKIKIGATDTAGDLHDKLMAAGAQLIVETVRKIRKKMEDGGELKFETQQDSLANHAPKLNKDLCRINWHLRSREVYNLVRGLSPYPTAFTELQNEEGQVKNLKIFFAEYSTVEHGKPVGTIDTDNNNFLNVYCSDGLIQIKDIQLEGKKRMKVHEFLKGYKISAGTKMIV